MKGAPVFFVGTRGSPLALQQANQVIQAFVSRQLGTPSDFQIVPIQTTGDQIQDQLLRHVGGKNLFATEIQAALHAQKIHMAVHSLKDLDSESPPSLCLAATLPRAHPWDAWIHSQGISWQEAPWGTRVGTCAPRRVSQLKQLRPDFVFVPLRGNVDTRLQKMERGECDALVLSQAGLDRLQLSNKITHIFSLEEMVPASCQGVIGVECRQDDLWMRHFLSQIHDHQTGQCVQAERAFVRTLQATCHTPVGAFAQWTLGQDMSLTGFLEGPRGGGGSLSNSPPFVQRVRKEKKGASPRALGRQLANEILKTLRISAA